MTKTGTDSQTDEQHERQEAAAPTAHVMHTIALLARELNGVHSLSESFRFAFEALSKLIRADSLAATTSAGEDRQQLRARLDDTGQFNFLADGEAVRVSHTMLERPSLTLAPVAFNNAQSELTSSELLITLVCAQAQSILCAPLVVDAKATGMIIISAKRAGAFSEGDAEIAGTIASLLAATGARIASSEKAEGAHERERVRQREETFIEHLLSGARSAPDFDRIIQHTIDTLARALPSSFVVLRTVSFGRPEPVMRAWTPGHDRPPLEIHAPISKVERIVYTEQRPVTVENMREEGAGGAAGSGGSQEM
ncbi:MAG TPA: GAF domain-containing protein, partial [Pyrinomonadaceae bacterium]|nr:GAF domain-containing protein [Pyrinomonadaceae bacterium]